MILSFTTIMSFTTTQSRILHAIDRTNLISPWQLTHLILFILVLAILPGCTGFKHRPIDEVGFKERAETQTYANIHVTASVLSAEESKEFFGANLYQKSIQPIWLEVKNDDEVPVWFLPAGTDRGYFSPLEVVYINRSGYSKEGLREMGWHFHNNAMGNYIGPGTVRSGFIFTNLNLGTKSFNVDLVGEDHQVRSFTFFIPVPGLRVDHQEVDWENLYTIDEIVSYDEAELRKALQELPCCTTNQDGIAQGEPINLVIIGTGINLHRALIRSGWNETASAQAKSASKATKSYPGLKKYLPVDPLYYYGRHQDAGLRKARKTGAERSQLRLWLSPMKLNDTPVWLGQISDGETGSSTSDKPVSRKTNLDEDRFYLTQDLMYSQALLKTAHINANEPTTLSQPGKTFRGTHYVTDGSLRVIWVTADPVSYDEIEFLEWDIPLEQENIMK